MILALSGGVGGAKLVSGLAAVCPPDTLAAVVNTGDDFDYLGLRICPDLDSVMYATAGLNDTVRGWGRRDESWAFHGTLPQLGFESWFQLGDRDLATHVLRTEWLRQGASLSEVTGRLCGALGLRARLLPMSDTPVSTLVETDGGELAFQDYFVRQRCEPAIRGVRFAGADSAEPPPALAEVLASPALAGIVICPSNPFVSIDPILAVAGIRRALEARRVPAVAVSPLVAGKAVKGPAAKMMAELGYEVSSASVAQHYVGLIDAMLIDSRDIDQAAAVAATGIRVAVADTLMSDPAAQARVAHATLSLLRERAGN